MTATTPAKPTPFGYCSYPAYYTLEPVYFRDGDPLVTYEKPRTWSNGRETGGWRDERTLEQKNADQLAAFTAEKNWRAGQEALAAQERRQREQEESAAKRVDDWRKLFHTREELEKLPALSFAIDGWLQEESITMIGGPSGDGKTLIALEMVKCLLDGSPLFGHFATIKRAKRVVYLIPESGARAFKHRLEIFKLMPYVGTQLFVRTLDSPEETVITDPAILKACEGADVFLDTAVRFMEGDENASGDSKRFAQNLFALIRAKARTVTGLHHSPKEFQRAQMMTLENVLRGSGDIGAMLATCWGILQIDHETTSIYVQNTKPRDFVPCAPFVITGRPSIDRTGHFEMTTKPGFAESFASIRQRTNGKEPGRPKELTKVNKALKMRSEGKTADEIADALEVNRATVFRWFKAAGGGD